MSHGWKAALNKQNTQPTSKTRSTQGTKNKRKPQLRALWKRSLYDSPSINLHSGAGAFITNHQEEFQAGCSAAMW